MLLQWNILHIYRSLFCLFSSFIKFWPSLFWLTLSNNISLASKNCAGFSFRLVQKMENETDNFFSVHSWQRTFSWLFTLIFEEYFTLLIYIKRKHYACANEFGTYSSWVEASISCAQVCVGCWNTEEILQRFIYAVVKST